MTSHRRTWGLFAVLMLTWVLVGRQVISGGLWPGLWPVAAGVRLPPASGLSLPLALREYTVNRVYYGNRSKRSVGWWYAVMRLRSRPQCLALELSIFPY